MLSAHQAQGCFTCASIARDREDWAPCCPACESLIASFRQVWGNYMANVSGVVFIVDAADRTRFQEAQEEIGRWQFALEHSLLCDVDSHNQAL
eukprot:2267825-Amphidinium_carterae.1